MYSLPITTYSDYWRRTKLWSAYIGSMAVFVAGTRYSPLDKPEMEKKVRTSFQSMNSLSLDRESINELKGNELLNAISNRGLGGQELIKKGQISRGLSSPIVDDEAARTNKLEKRLTSEIEIIDKELPFDTQYIESDELPPGTSQIKSIGDKGVRREVVKNFEVDGQPVDQHVLSSYELKSPKTEVIIRNTKPIPKKKVTIPNSYPGPSKVSVDLTKLNISKTLRVEASAYTHTGSNTATGIKPREGIIAVDPKVIAMGSKVYVEGYGYAIAADTGGSIRGNRIDVFFSSLRQCIDWGRRPVLIHVIDSN